LTKHPNVAPYRDMLKLTPFLLSQSVVLGIAWLGSMEGRSVLAAMLAAAGFACAFAQFMPGAKSAGGQ
jgi:hypothetical protein